MLHPRHKLSYFRKLNWSSDWIALAKSLVYEEFERNYAAISEAVEEEEDSIDKAASPRGKVSNAATMYMIYQRFNANYYFRRKK